MKSPLIFEISVESFLKNNSVSCILLGFAGCVLESIWSGNFKIHLNINLCPKDGLRCKTHKYIETSVELFLENSVSCNFTCFAGCIKND